MLLGRIEVKSGSIFYRQQIFGKGRCVAFNDLNSADIHRHQQPLANQKILHSYHEFRELPNIELLFSFIISLDVARDMFILVTTSSRGNILERSSFLGQESAVFDPQGTLRNPQTSVRNHVYKRNCMTPITTSSANVPNIPR